jgi:hypothetical protein
MYNLFTLFFLIYLNIKIAVQFTIMVIITINSNKIFKKIKEDHRLSEATTRDIINDIPKTKQLDDIKDSTFVKDTTSSTLH